MTPGRGLLQDTVARRWAVGLLLALYVVGSWAPFRLDPPFRAEDVTVDGSGAWRFSGRSLATSVTSPEWLADAVDGGYLEVELEVSSASARQDGPARLLTISRDTRHQNLVVGQAGDDLIVRARRPGADLLGEPALVVPDVFASPDWRTIQVRIHRDVSVEVDGTAGDTAAVAGDPFVRWDRDHVLALGNERSWDRGWRGAIRRAAVRTQAGETDLLASGLTTTWDRAWKLPGRLFEDPDRPLRQRVLVWAFHLLFSVVVVFAMARAWPRRSALGVALIWAGLAMLVNLGKIVVDVRHPSVVTAVLQVAGGGVGAWLASRAARHGPTRAPGLEPGYPVDHAVGDQPTDREGGGGRG